MPWEQPGERYLGYMRRFRQGAEGQRKWRCAACGIGDAKSTCYLREGQVWTAPPYHHVSRYQSLRIGSTAWPERRFFGWAPASEVVDGPRLVEAWRGLARADELECEPPGEAVRDCKATLSLRGGADREQLWQCYSLLIDGQNGPLSLCEPLAVIDGRQVWVSMVEGATFDPLSLDDGPSFDILTRASPSIEAILSGIKQTLRAAPIGLQAEHRERRIGAIARQRSSAIFSGWWERVSIQFFVEPARSSKEIAHQQFAITTVSSMVVWLVKEQNTASASDFHLPSDAQKGLYQEALMSSLRQTLPSICPGGRWHEASALLCP